MTEQHKPFDPAVPKRLRAAVTAATLSHSTFASPRASDLEQLLERDAYAEQTRLQLAEKCAALRSQRDEAYSSIWLIAQSLASLAAFQLAATPDDSAWNIVNASAQQLLAAGRPQRDQKAAHAPQERPASAPATVETNPTPNRPQTGVPPLEAAGIFFPGSTPSAIPETADRLALQPQDPQSSQQLLEYWYEKWETAYDEQGKIHNQLNAAYRERAHLVALLASIWASHIGYSDPNERDWAVVIITTPAGQLSWHVARSDMDLFAHVEVSTSEHDAWDGHTTEQKYQRIDRLVADLGDGQTRKEA